MESASLRFYLFFSFIGEIMKKAIMLCAILILGSGIGHAAAKAPGDMTGTWGVGAANTGADNAVTGTYWVMNALAIDGLLGFGSTATSVSSVSTGSQFNFLIGAAGRYDLAKPMPDLHIQVIGRLSYSSMPSVSTIDTFVGAGFEGFIPGWHGVSLEISTGLHAYISTLTYSYLGVGSATGTQSGFYLGGGNGVLPVNLAVHCYF
jgi:hypothetical protein